MISIDYVIKHKKQFSEFLLKFNHIEKELIE